MRDKTGWPRVAIDQDGVLANFDAGIADHLGLDRPVGAEWNWMICAFPNAEGPVYADGTRSCGRFASRNQMWKAVERELLFATLPVQDDTVIDGMRELNQIAHTTLITSAHPWARLDKLYWMHGNRIDTDDAVFTHHSDKWRYPFDYLIEDKPSTLKSCYYDSRGSGARPDNGMQHRPTVVRRRQPWNEDSLTWDESVDCFAEFVDLVRSDKEAS